MWTTQPGWILTFHEWEDDRILGILVANHAEEQAVNKLKRMAYERHHPRGGKSNLRWELHAGIWEARGRYYGHVYEIAPYTVEVMG